MGDLLSKDNANTGQKRAYAHNWLLHALQGFSPRGMMQSCEPTCNLGVIRAVAPEATIYGCNAPFCTLARSFSKVNL
jgi:hypothetical protein